MAFMKKYKACDDCGVRNLIDVRFCTNCGKNFFEEEEVQEPTTTQEVKESKVVDEKFSLIKVPTEFKGGYIDNDSKQIYNDQELLKDMANKMEKILKAFVG